MRAVASRLAMHVAVHLRVPLLLLVVVASAAATVAPAVAPAVGQPQEQRESRVSDQQAPAAARRMTPAERWAALPPERRAELRERWSKVRELPPEQRARLRRVASRLRELERGLPRELDAATRERLQRLAPQEREAVVRDLVVSRAASEARSALRRLPAEVSERLDELPPDERRRALEGALSGRLERLLGAMIDQPQRFGFEREVVEPLRSLPLEARKQSLLVLLRERILSRLDEAPQRPPGLERQRLERLEPEAFARALLRTLDQQPEMSWLLVQNRQGAPLDGERGRRHRSRRLHTALEVRPDDLLPEEEGSPRDRRRHALHRQRGRVLRVLEEEGLVPAEEFERLRTAPDQEVVRFAARFAAGREGRRSRGVTEGG